MVFQASASRHTCRACVLIPSFSGWCFKQDRLYDYEELNVLIPSFSGWCFKRCRMAICTGWNVLIPSFSGWCFKLYDYFNQQSGVCLNPFFFRVVFQATASVDSHMVWIVLIPSFSGWCFKQLTGGGLRTTTTVLIPSFSGWCFKQSKQQRLSEI